MSPLFIFLISCLIFGIVVALFLASRRKYRSKSELKAPAVEHYEETRDQLTTREEVEEIKEDEGFSFSQLPILRLIGGFVAILVGVTLCGGIKDQIQNTVSTTNMYNSSQGSLSPASALDLVPGFFALGILGVGIAVVLGSFNNSGLFEKEDQVERKEKKKPNKSVAKPIKHYTNMRDTMTMRKKDNSLILKALEESEE